MISLRTDNPVCELPNVAYVNSFIRRIAAALPSMARALGVAVDPQWQDIALHQVPLPTARINGTDEQVFTMCDTNETVQRPGTAQARDEPSELQVIEASGSNGCPCPGHPGRTFCPLDPTAGQCDKPSVPCKKAGGSCATPTRGAPKVSKAWCKDVGLNPWTVHPGGGVNLGDDETTLAIARRSFEDITQVVGMNNFCSSFGAAVRIGIPAKDVLAGFRNSTRPCRHASRSDAGSRAEAKAGAHPPPPPAPHTCLLPNGLIYQSGGVEIAGAAEFVNGMLMQSVTAHDGSGVVTTMLFPAWDRSQDAAFSQLRARGAFLISANYSAAAKQVLSPVKVTSEAGQVLRLRNPWRDKPTSQVHVRDVQTGAAVEVVWEDAVQDGVMSFATGRGASYTVSLSQ